MSRFFVSVRGFVNHPCIIVVDLDKQSIVDVLEFPQVNLSHIPETKRGFSGLAMHQGLLYAATWDRICVIEPNTGDIVDTITDKRFSDLHSLHIEDDGTLWITSTNIDGIYKFTNGTVSPYWHAWQEDLLKGRLSLDNIDYRQLTKAEIPVYNYHLNSVFANEQYVMATYLGAGLYSQSWFTRLLIKMKLSAKLKRFGGIFILDRRNGKLISRIQTEGLHDLQHDRNGLLYSTEYFRNTLTVLDINDFSIKNIKLDIPPYTEGYLTRGVHVLENSIWAGHTTHRNSINTGSNAALRNYNFSGQWTGKEIQLEGYSGVYTLVPAESS